MTSKTDICNLALANLGQPPINSLDDNNERSRRLLLYYPVALGETLRAHPWKFARTIAPLACLDARVPGWRYVYEYPTNAAAVLAVKIEDKSVPFKVASLEGKGRVILAQIPNAYAVYTRLEENTDVYDASFIKVLSWTLACDVALAITCSTDLMQMANNQKEMELDKARYANREEGDTCVQYECSYLPGGHLGRGHKEIV